MKQCLVILKSVATIEKPFYELVVIKHFPISVYILFTLLSVAVVK
jgi:hypothetical protein